MTNESFNDLTKWFLNGNTGRSSKFIVSYILYQDKTNYAYPLDPSDLKRCFELLELVPELKPQLFKLSSAGSEWASLVKNWDILIESLKSELHLDTAPKTYKIMKQLLVK